MNEAQAAWAGPVRVRYRRHVRDAARFIAVAAVAYLGLVWSITVASGMDAVSGGDGSLGGTSLTIADPAIGATLLALFAGLVVALNVSAWSIRIVSPHPSTGADGLELGDRTGLYARYLILSKAARACGVAAVLVGMATFVGGLSGSGKRELILGIATLAATAVICVISVDTSAWLGDGPEIETAVRRHRDSEDLSRLRRAATAWSSPWTSRPRWFTQRAARNLWLACDVSAAVAMTAAVPLLVAALDALVGNDTWLEFLDQGVAIVVVSCIVVAIVGLLWISIVIGLVRGDMVSASLMAALGACLGCLWLTELVDILIAREPSALAKASSCMVWIALLVVPLGLAIRATRVVGRTGAVPGRSLRWFVRHLLLGWITTLEADLGTDSTGVRPPASGRSPLVSRWINDLGDWYRRISGRSAA